MGISQETSQDFMKENEDEDVNEDVDEDEDEVSERERVLLTELQNMKQKKQQVEKLLTELNAIKCKCQYMIYLHVLQIMIIINLATQHTSVPSTGKSSPEKYSSRVVNPVHEYVGDSSQLYELKSKMK